MIEEKRSKYDTDPLDPEFVRRTEIDPQQLDELHIGIAKQ